MTGDEPTLNIGLRVIIAVLLNSLGNFSARDLRCKSLLTFESTKVFRGIWVQSEHLLSPKIQTKTRFGSFYRWILSFHKLTILKSSSLESPDWGNDISYNARRVKAYIDPNDLNNININTHTSSHVSMKSALLGFTHECSKTNASSSMTIPTSIIS